MKSSTMAQLRPDCGCCRRSKRSPCITGRCKLNCIQLCDVLPSARLPREGGRRHRSLDCLLSEGATMAWRELLRGLLTVFVVGILSRPASAQITTGTVTGAVKDEQGLAVPGASVTLVSEARQTRIAPVFTSSTGEFVVTGVTADTYTIEISLEGFRPIHRTNVIISGGDRVTLGAHHHDGWQRIGDGDGHRGDATHSGAKRRAVVLDFHRSGAGDCRQRPRLQQPDARWRPASSPARSTAFASTRTRCRLTASRRSTPATTATASR